MKFVIANWKMNGDLSLAADFKNNFKDNFCAATKIIVCPPTALLAAFSGFQHALGAQNCFYEDHGAFTGENSPKLLKELGCKYVILGHSERRSIFAESDDMIFEKWLKVIDLELTPILCIGENADQRKEWKIVLKKQLEKYVARSADLHGTIFAYEPVWSIGTGQIPSSEEIEEAAAFIRNTLEGKNDKNENNSENASENCCSAKPNYYVVYGGSVKGSNAANIINIRGIDGVLVGSASLKIPEFKKIIEESELYR